MTAADVLRLEVLRLMARERVRRAALMAKVRAKLLAATRK
jgi:hypothetical protein